MPTIIVLFPTGHRASIEVEPNKPLRKALESACSRRCLDPTKYIFIHNRRPVDLSTSFRFSGLVNNASLELVANDAPDSNLDGSTEVRICFRLDNGHRAVWSGSPHCSLWNILDQLAASTPEISQLLSVSGDSSGNCLAVIYLQEQVVGVSKLKESTPADLGVLRGSALFQLKTVVPPVLPSPSQADTCKQRTFSTREEVTLSDHHQTVEKLHLDTHNEAAGMRGFSENLQFNKTASDATSTTTEAVATANSPLTGIISPFSIFEKRPTESIFGQREQPQISDHQPQTLGELLGISLEPASSPMDFTPAVQPDFQSSEFRFPSETSGVDLRPQSFEDLHGQTNTEVDRQLVAFRQPPATTTPVSISADDELPDDIFEHTVNDLRSLLQHCRSEWMSSEPLQTAAMRRAARERMYRKYPRAIIQFHWSDGVVLQCCFDPRERVSSLYDFVGQRLRNPNSEFHLYTTPPRMILKDQTASLIDANLVPMAKVYFSASMSTKGEDTLLGEVLSNATVENAAVAEQIVRTWMSSVAASHQTSVPDVPVTQSNTPFSEGVSREGPNTPPKWLKIGK